MLLPIRFSAKNRMTVAILFLKIKLNESFAWRSFAENSMVNKSDLNKSLVSVTPTVVSTDEELQGNGSSSNFFTVVSRSLRRWTEGAG